MITISFPRANPWANFRVMQIQGKTWRFCVWRTINWRGDHAYPKDKPRLLGSIYHGGLMLITTRIEWSTTRRTKIG